MFLTTLVTLISHCSALQLGLPPTQPTCRVVCIDENPAAVTKPWAAHLEARLNVHFQASPFQVSVVGQQSLTAIAAADYILWRASIAQLKDSAQTDHGKDLRRLIGETTHLICPPHEVLIAPQLHESWLASAQAVSPAVIDPHQVMDSIASYRSPKHQEFVDHALSAAVYTFIARREALPVANSRATQITPSAEFRSGAGWHGATWRNATTALELQARSWGDVPLVFLGDSITQGLTGHGQRLCDGSSEPSNAVELAFGDVCAASLGFSGDRTEHLRYRIRSGALRWLQPRVIVLQIGINNLQTAQDTPEQVAAGIEAVIDDLLRFQPQARVLVCGPFPAGKTADAPIRLAVDRVHSLLQRKVDAWTEHTVHGRPAVLYSDLRHHFLTDEGLPGAGMARDALHLNRRGQDIWMQAIQSQVHSVLNQAAVPELKSNLAWLAPNFDYPRMSYRLMVLEPGAAGPRCLLQPILHSIDDADSAAISLGRGNWLVNGLVTWTRDRPNVRTNLYRVNMSGEHAEWAQDVTAFAVEADSGALLWAHRNGIQFNESSAELNPVTIVEFPAAEVRVKQLNWGLDGEAYAFIENSRPAHIPRWRSGLWRLNLQGGKPKFIGIASGVALDSQQGQVYFVNDQNQLCAKQLDAATEVQVLMESEHGFGRIQWRGGHLAFEQLHANAHRTIGVLNLATGQRFDFGPGKLPTLSSQTD